MRRPSFASSGVALSTGERTRPPRGSPHTTSRGRGLSSYAHTKRNRRPARGRAACELPNAFPSIGTRATYRQLRPARYPQTRAVADKKRRPARRSWSTQAFQSPSLVVKDGETQRCRRSASGEEDVLRVYA